MTKRPGAHSPPDRSSRARKAKPWPFFGNSTDDLFVHADEPPPFAFRLGRELVGGVETDLGAQAGFRRGEIERVARRAFDESDVARRSHARGHRPHHVLPVPRVDVVVYHNYPFR